MADPLVPDGGGDPPGQAIFNMDISFMALSRVWITVCLCPCAVAQ